MNDKIENDLNELIMNSDSEKETNSVENIDNNEFNHNKVNYNIYIHQIIKIRFL